jgi:hypothetical protein
MGNGRFSEQEIIFNSYETQQLFLLPGQRLHKTGSVFLLPSRPFRKMPPETKKTNHLKSSINE